MWTEWKDSFAMLLSNPDNRICKIGKIGHDRAIANEETSLEKEHKEDVYGR